jgi:hypothetical protein
MPPPSSSGDNVHMTVVSNHGCRCCSCWPVGTCRRVRRWPNSWAFTGIRGATGSPFTRRVVWMRCGTSMCRPTSLGHSRQAYWRRWRRRSGTPRVWPPMKPCASGFSRRTTWRSMITPATPSSAPSFKPTSTCRGPVTPKNPDALPAFHATGQERLAHVMPPDHARPVRVCSQDDSRFGLLTVRRRRLTAGGVPPVGAVPHVCAWCYV